MENATKGILKASAPGMKMIVVMSIIDVNGKVRERMKVTVEINYEADIPKVMMESALLLNDPDFMKKLKADDPDFMKKLKAYKNVKLNWVSNDHCIVTQQGTHINVSIPERVESNLIDLLNSIIKVSHE
jgi:hypothetical protein